MSVGRPNTIALADTNASKAITPAKVLPVSNPKDLDGVNLLMSYFHDVREAVSLDLRKDELRKVLARREEDLTKSANLYAREAYPAHKERLQRSVQQAKTALAAHEAKCSAVEKTVEASVRVLATRLVPSPPQAQKNEKQDKLEIALKETRQELSQLKTEKAAYAKDLAVLVKRVEGLQSKADRQETHTPPSRLVNPGGQDDVPESILAKFKVISTEVKTLQEMLKKVSDDCEITNATAASVEGRVKSLESRNSEAATSMQKKQLKDIEGDLKKWKQKMMIVENEVKDLKQSPPNPLPAVPESEPTTIQEMREKIDQISTTCSQLKDLPQLVGRISATLQTWAPIVASVQAEAIAPIQALKQGLQNLDSRFNNLNTLDMSQHILSQVETLYPSLRHYDTTLVGLRFDVDKTKANLNSVHEQHIALASLISSMRADLQRIDGSSNTRTSDTLESIKTAVAKLEKAHGDTRRIVEETIPELKLELEDIQAAQAELNKQDNTKDERTLAEDMSKALEEIRKIQSVLEKLPSPEELENVRYVSLNMLPDEIQKLENRLRSKADKPSRIPAVQHTGESADFKQPGGQPSKTTNGHGHTNGNGKRASQSMQPHATAKKIRRESTQDGQSPKPGETVYHVLSDD